MVKKLTEAERRKLHRLFDSNEANNRHTANSLMLIDRFGSEKIKALAKKKVRKIRTGEGLTKSQWDWFYNNGHKPHFKKLLPKKIGRKK